MAGVQHCFSSALRRKRREKKSECCPPSSGNSHGPLCERPSAGDSVGRLITFLLDSFVLMPFPTSTRIVYMLCEQIVIAPLFLRFFATLFASALPEHTKSARLSPSAKELRINHVGIGSIIDNRKMPFSALIFRSPPYFSVSVLMERVPKPWYSLFSLLVCGSPSTNWTSPA